MAGKRLSKETMMKCPVDNETLVMTERSGVEIDYCPKCRGVWLDRGELDKIIERADTGQGAVAAATPPPSSYRGERYGHEQDRYRGTEHEYRQEKPYKKKRESFLGDLFDF
jgi:Zn-finger nucleic acid-binding protein